ncbi:MAG: HAD hydrolase-like protein [Desulfobacteraceae bacterium]|nr:HAD hydrolase-like protein [Desulfobacteraceae bacterium]
MKYLIIFDYDGVIVDSLDTNLKIAALACQKIGYPVHPSQADIEQLENIAFDDIGRQIGVPENKIPKFTEIVFDLLAQNTISPPIFPGIKTAIQKLRKKSHLAVITTNIKIAVNQVLERGGLSQYIDLVMGAEQNGSKSEKICQAMAAFDVSSNFTYMIGDAVSDIRQAHKAGVNSIAVNWGYHPREKLLQASPGHMVNTPEDIMAIVR